MKACLAALLIAIPLSAQHRVDPRNMYERLLCIVPMVGKGTWDDPKRPMFAPSPSEMNPSDRSGIVSWHFEPSDDGTLALVEFVAVQKGVLNRLAGRDVPGFKVLERGKRKELEAAVKSLRKQFDIDRFLAGMPQ